LHARITAMRDPGLQCQWLADELETIARYIEERGSALEDSDTHNRIFIGHCSSPAWRSLHRYLEEVLGLQTPWFDDVPPQGFAAEERLRGMVEGVVAAFIVFTLEDELSGHQAVVRENVAHEIGLFQGRLGPNRAFILLEEGCEGFSGVHGVAQIRFPAGRIEASFADIRRVLERGKIL
jgi:predicted nucleotide-binding protein